jgi:hypothetical protein
MILVLETSAFTIWLQAGVMASKQEAVGLAGIEPAF